MNINEEDFLKFLSETPVMGARIAWAISSLGLVKVDPCLIDRDEDFVRGWWHHPEHIKVDIEGIKDALRHGDFDNIRNVGVKVVETLRKILGVAKPLSKATLKQLRDAAMHSSRFTRLRQRRGLPFKSRRQP